MNCPLVAGFNLDGNICSFNLQISDTGLRACKVDGNQPEYSTVTCQGTLTYGRHLWECTWEQVGNGRAGLAEVVSYQIDLLFVLWVCKLLRSATEYLQK